MYMQLLDKGYAALRRGDAEAALRNFQRATEEAPERPQAYFALAQAYIEQGSSEKTLRSLEAALKADPTYAPARAFLGIELFKNYDVSGAEDALEQAFKDEPTNLLVRIKYAEYYYRLGFYPRAVTMLEEGLLVPHGANEHVVAMARKLLTQARQRSKGIIVREPPDPRHWLRLFARLRKKASLEAVAGQQ
jgi:tetratricopeptide (TPR) repeat protein